MYYLPPRHLMMPLDMRLERPYIDLQFTPGFNFSHPKEITVGISKKKCDSDGDRFTSPPAHRSPCIDRFLQSPP